MPLLSGIDPDNYGFSKYLSAIAVHTQCGKSITKILEELEQVFSNIVR